MLPFAPGAAREILRADPDFVALVGADPSVITTRELPDPLVRPCVTIAAAINRRLNEQVSSVRLMLNAWVPKAELLVDNLGLVIDPEELAWNIAATAGQILDMRRMMGRGPSFEFRGARWRGVWDEGPTTLVDVERGPDNPIYRAVIQVQMNIGKQ
ncbi:hypothetical protein [Gordonia sp. (in: high G+C Gram-positive bacteria)]|jgi:hypothetical protein|uniref:hypothetical protein n=1 Tax=Gordonia sp. (in: high G+C Gram-positive bacteria) TaxID=84139 RepID=UPI001D9BC9C1|nr:hypothetical protein [Gordonia sp. (in: high G+C Gram-positive bacteria)]MCB1294835.1 hypothetical protein [Gordonia sp. (in: high G+C Gram-positive bacteria)]HMS75608.1 hypothetical protein [Gordonia sp. (in: high G+C Gram-positive bacteria)]HQV20638.1 hypothetical protein [Gordonia sp. (in: high G+C Gram-positive bacteria)]